MLCVCVCRASSTRHEGRTEETFVCVYVFHYDYFPVASFFLLLLLLPLLLQASLSSSRQAQQPSSHMCYALFSSSNAQPELASELISSCSSSFSSRSFLYI